MKRVRLTALAVATHPELSRLYENELEQACCVKIGDSWESIDRLCPENFCQSAWSNLQPFVFALANGASVFFDGWMKHPDTAMISCNDGFRPVSFYLEAISSHNE